MSKHQNRGRRQQQPPKPPVQQPEPVTVPPKLKWYAVPVLWGRLLRLQKHYKRIAKVVGWGSAVGSFIILIIPKISISPSVNVDPTDAFGTKFAVKNEGYVPVLYPIFGCTFNGEDSSHNRYSNITSESNGGHSMPEIFWPGSTVTRDCGASMSGVTMDVSVDAYLKYRWPILIWSSTQKTHFTGIHGKSGYFLVPDVAD